MVRHCGVNFLVVGLFALAGCVCFGGFAGWSLYLRHTLTPVFRDVECSVARPEILDLSPVGGVHLAFVVRTTCHNPNPYAVTIRSTGPAMVFCGGDFIPVSTVQDVPEAVLPIRGSKEIRHYVKTQPNPRLPWDAFLGASGLHTIPVYMETTASLDVDVGFLLTGFETAHVVEKRCGFAVRSESWGDAETSPVACAESFGDVHLPPIDDPAQESYAVGLTEGEIAEGSRARDIGLWTCFGLGIAAGASLLLVAVVAFCRACKSMIAARELRKMPREEERPVHDEEVARGTAAGEEGAAAEAEEGIDVVGRMVDEDVGEGESTEVHMDADTANEGCTCWTPGHAR